MSARKKEKGMGGIFYMTTLHHFDTCGLFSRRWYYLPLTTATAQASANIAFIK